MVKPYKSLRLFYFPEVLLLRIAYKKLRNSFLVRSQNTFYSYSTITNLILSSYKINIFQRKIDNLIEASFKKYFIFMAIYRVLFHCFLVHFDFFSPRCRMLLLAFHVFHCTIICLINASILCYVNSRLSYKFIY